MKIPKKVLDRLQGTLKTFQNIASIQKSRDVSEADTVTLVKDMLADMFGFDKYLELTSEQQIRGTYCDLAVKIDGKIRYLIEVKSAGIALSDAHLRQALNYGANQGIEWIVLTNGLDWRLYRIKFGQPIDFEEVSSFHLPSLNLRNEEDVKRIFLLCREGISSDAMDVFHQNAQLLNKYTITQVLTGEAVVSSLRKEMRRLFPELKVETENLLDIILNDVLKREVLEGDRVKDAQSRIKKAQTRIAKAATIKPPKIDATIAENASDSGEAVTQL